MANYDVQQSNCLYMLKLNPGDISCLYILKFNSHDINKSAAQVLLPFLLAYGH